MDLFDVVPIWPLLVIAAVGGVWVVFRKKFKLKQPASGPGEYPYRATRYLLSKAERSFFEVLCRAVPPGYCVFVKVRLADLVRVERSAKHRQSALNRITGKHVDFLLCDSDGITPELVVELDDSSHGRASRRNRDRLVDAVLDAAGLPILRVPAARGYHVNALKQKIGAELGVQPELEQNVQ